MDDKLFLYQKIREELCKRGFFIVTDFAPEHCIGICLIQDVEKRIKYVEYLQEHYHMAAIKNIIFTVGQGDSLVDRFYEILIGSWDKEPYPMIYIHIRYKERYYTIAYSCDRIMKLGSVGHAMEYFVDCLKFITSRLTGYIQEWITEGKFPKHRFGEGSEELIIQNKIV